MSLYRIWEEVLLLLHWSAVVKPTTRSWRAITETQLDANHRRVAQDFIET